MKIAYIGRFEGIADTQDQKVRSQDFNFIHTHSLLNYIEKFNLNQSEYQIQLEIFNNHKNPDSTNSVYQKIAEDNSIIAVIDNTWGGEISAASEIISKNSIPVIAINASINKKNDFGNSFIATTNYRQAFNEIGYFIKKGLISDSVILISAVNTWKHIAYIKALESNGVKVYQQLTYEVGEDEKAIDDIKLDEISRIANNEFPILLNTPNRDDGEKILDAISKNYSNKTLIGHAEIIGGGVVSSEITKENRLITLSQTQDAVPRDIAEQIIHFQKEFQEIHNAFNTAFFFSRCKYAWSILEQSILNSNVNRMDFSEFIHSLFNSSLETQTDLFFFDIEGSMIRENTFVEHSKLGENASFVQINSQGNLIPNMNFGIEIIDIQSIDLNTNSFGADFYYWVVSDSSLNRIEEFITFQNIKPSESEFELITTKTFGEYNYKLYKVSGVFLERYDETNYPFDEQEISIDIQILNSFERLRVSFDRESFNQEIEDLSLKGWMKKEFFVTVDNKITDRLKGNMDLAQMEQNKFKNISFRLNVVRSKLPGFLQVILPLFFIGILSVALLYLKNLKFSHIGEPLAAVFLTIIAFSISLSDITPTGNILTKADFLFILTLTTVVLSFIIGLLHNVKKGLSNRFVKIFRVSLTSIYLIAFTLILVIKN